VILRTCMILSKNLLRIFHKLLDMELQQIQTVQQIQTYLKTSQNYNLASILRYKYRFKLFRRLNNSSDSKNFRIVIRTQDCNLLKFFWIVILGRIPIRSDQSLKYQNEHNLKNL
jgi:hypothetical protein